MTVPGGGCFVIVEWEEKETKKEVMIIPAYYLHNKILSRAPNSFWTIQILDIYCLFDESGSIPQSKQSTQPILNQQRLHRKNTELTLA